MKLKPNNRVFAVTAEDIDVEARTVLMTFSSETTEVTRQFGHERGIEVLGHSESDTIDMSRLNNGAPFRDAHTGDQLGVIENARINPETKKGEAKVRFSKSTARAIEVFDDIVDDIRRNISAGYRVTKFIREAAKDGEMAIFRAVEWMPFEISTVPVPADQTVGIGRSLEEEEVEVEITDKQTEETTEERSEDSPEAKEESEKPFFSIELEKKKLLLLQKS